jgi:uncharacterized protein
MVTCLHDSQTGKTKMRKASLGTGIDIDVAQLIKSRLLVQANSGGGKSYTLRRLCEQTFGLVQHIIIDPEGEFYTLREKYDYSLLGKGGDGPADLKSAALLARRLLELGVSAIVDISELGVRRARFVKLFLEALVAVPRELWHPVIVVVDEAHKFCPEKGRGESESTAAVIDLMTVGRKRGFCGVLATQRVSKLNKDAAAECNNKLIGRCSLDVDRKRAGEELGFSDKDNVLSLRDLEAGEFFAYGPALSKTITKFKVGKVQTTHPEAGEIAPPVTPPRAKVKKVFEQLANLPHEAEEEAKNVVELQQEIRKLKNELREAQKSAKVETKEIKVPIVDKDSLKALLKGIDKLDASTKSLDTVRDRLAQAQQAVVSEGDNLRVFARQQLAKLKIDAPKTEGLPPRLHADAVTMHMQHRPKIGAPVIIGAQKHPPLRKSETVETSNGEFKMDGPAKRVLNALAWFEAIGINTPSATALAFMSNYSGENGAFNNKRGALRTAGLVDYPSPGTVALTDGGRKLAEMPDVPTTGEGLRAMVLAQLDGPEQRVLTPVIEAYPDKIMVDELYLAAGYSSAHGAFNNLRGRLRTLGLVTYPSQGSVRAADILFPD